MKCFIITLLVLFVMCSVHQPFLSIKEDDSGDSFLKDDFVYDKLLMANVAISAFKPFRINFADSHGNISIKAIVGISDDKCHSNGGDIVYVAIERPNDSKTYDAIIRVKAGSYIGVLKINNGHDKPVEEMINYLRNSPGCVESHKKLAKIIENSTDINAVDQSGLSALHYACETGNLEAVKDLIAKGANVNLPAIHVDSITPIYLAAQQGHLEIVKELCDHGATVNIHTMDGKTVLRAALNMGKYETVYYLISKGADVNAQGINKETALLDVTHYGNLKGEMGVVKALLDAKANINDQDISGKTPLMWVASRDVSWDVITLLLNAGADVEILDGQGKTAYDYAKDNPALRDSNKLNLLHQNSR